MQRFLLLFLSLVVQVGLSAQDLSAFRQQAKAMASGPGGIQMMQLTDPICLYRAEDRAHPSHVPPPAQFRPDEVQVRSEGSDCANIEVTYNGFEQFPEALAAFQYAVDIWESLITSPVTIRVEANFEPLGPGILGSAGPNFIVRDFPGAEPGTWYGSALADGIVGVDLIPGQVDIIANFSSVFGWYFGRDGNPPPGTYDFATVVLHELGHGLGFFGSALAIPRPVLGVYGFFDPGLQTTFPTIYDAFVQNSGGVAPADIAPPGVVSPALGTYFQSNDLFVNASSAVAANGGTLPAIYAPSSFRRGSSYSHWDEATFPPGTPQSLMTPFLSFQEANHDPGAITIGMFDDHGWTQTADCTPPEPVDDTQPCDIAEVTLDPLIPEPICDVNGAVGPPGSHAIFVRIAGIDPLSQPVDPSAYEAKVKGKVRDIFSIGYDFFEGELYLSFGIGGIPSDGKKNMQVKITLENGCVAVGPRLYDAPTCDDTPAIADAVSDQQAPVFNSVAGDVEMEVFPNPTSGRFTIRTGTGMNGSLQIFNSLGQRVYMNPIQEHDSRDIDLSRYQSGLYLIRLETATQTFTRQLLVGQ